MNQEVSIQKAAAFDHTNLKKVETTEKNILNQEVSIQKAAHYDHSKLKHTETQEKVSLPTTQGMSKILGRKLRIVSARTICSTAGTANRCTATRRYINSAFLQTNQDLKPKKL